MTNLKKIGPALDRTTRNQINDNVDETNRGFRNMQSQLDKVVAKGDSSPQASQASVGVDGTAYDSLKSRLDSEQNDVKHDLSLKRNKGDEIKGSELDVSSDSSKIKLINLADEVIKALTGNAPALPTLNNAAVNREKIASKAVSREKTQFQKLISKNVVDLDTVVTGGFYSPSNGSFSNNNAYYASSEILVRAGDIHRTNAASLAFYSSTYQFISGISPSELVSKLGVFDVPSGVTYVRLNFLTSINYPVCTLDSNNYLQAFEKVKYTDEGLSIGTGNIGKNFVISPQNTDFFTAERTVNLFNSNDVVLGRYNEKGEYSYNSNNAQVTSNFIAGTPGEQFISSTSGFVTFYDSQRNFVSGLTPRTYFTIPSGVSYFRTTSFFATKDSEMVVKGTTLPGMYIPYFRYNLKGYAREKSKYNGLTWAALGDSITGNYNYAEKLYHDFINDKFGFGEIKNYGIGGSTVAKVGDDTNNSMALRYKDMGEADLITVFGGRNDGSRRSGTNEGRVPIGQMGDRTVETFYGAYHVLLSGLIEKYPVGKIAVFTPLQSAAADMSRYAQVVREVSAYYSIPCLDLYASSGFYAGSQTQVETKMPDGTHPNVWLQEEIAEKIGPFLESI